MGDMGKMEDLEREGEGRCRRREERKIMVRTFEKGLRNHAINVLPERTYLFAYINCKKSSHPG